MVNATSFLEVFYEREKHHPNKIYLRQPEGDVWHELSWAEVGQQARKILAALKDLGLQTGDHVGILSKNCREWIIADLAILMGGFVSIPYYPTLPANELNEVINLSEIKALFVGKLDHWEQQQAGVPEHVTCIAFPHYPGNSEVNCKLQWHTLQSHYSPAEDVHHPSQDDLFTIIYTSGTTGSPKGVMLSYECVNQVLIHERQSGVYGVYQGVSERVISYLPLNHIAERIISEVSPIIAGSIVSFSESLDTFARNLQSVQPTQFFAVPRIWAKFQQGILSKLPQKKLNLLLKIPFVNNAIRHKILSGLGLNQLRSAISGAAPVSASMLHWFADLGIHIQEVYGATETCGGITYNAIDDIVPGTVGKPIPGTSIKIDLETDEVLVKSPWNMVGYYKDPEKTAEVFDGDYYRTGDTGRFDDDGNLIITGRIKDTFKTAKGKFILPVPMEHKLSRNLLIEQVMITGIGMIQPMALVCLSENACELSDEDIANTLLETLESVNRELESYARISNMVVFRQVWSEDSGFFTPTLKLKRHIVDATFKDNYENWGRSKQSIVWSD